MRIGAIGAAALLALAVAGGAQAKGPDLARACGASGCTTIHGDVHVYELIEWTYTPFTLADAPRPAPFYRITFRDRGTLFMTYLYVPARNLVRVWQGGIDRTYEPAGGHPYWRPVSARGRSVLNRVVARLKPFSRPRTWR